MKMKVEIILVFGVLLVYSQGEVVASLGDTALSTAVLGMYGSIPNVEIKGRVAGKGIEY
jgi:hypothetical protein